MDAKDQRRLALADELTAEADRLSLFAQRLSHLGDPGGAHTLGMYAVGLRNIADGLEYGEDGNRLRKAKR